MAYRAIRNFKIGREITQSGQIYAGGDIGTLLASGLIEEIKDEAELPISPPKPQEVAPQEEPIPAKKSKKKKG